MLAKSTDGTETALVLNTVVLLRDGKPGDPFEITAKSSNAKPVNPVSRRLEYLQGK